MPQYQEEIQRGMAWLDETRPGWPEMVNLERLAMQSGYDCVLGQVFEKDATEACCGCQSGFDWASETFKVLAPTPGFDGCCGADDLGFCQPEAWRFATLTEEWKESIAERRNEVPA